jgi:hypothetical protein
LQHTGLIFTPLRLHKNKISRIGQHLIILLHTFALTDNKSLYTNKKIENYGDNVLPKLWDATTKRGRTGNKS